MITFSLGLVFFSLGFIGDTMSPLKSYPPFRSLIENSENPWIGVLIGAGFTALIQSSSATMGIVIVLASQGMMTLPAGVAMMLGAEIGTCADTLIANAHVFFNVGGVVLFIGFTNASARFLQWLIPDTRSKKEQVYA